MSQVVAPVSSAAGSQQAAPTVPARETRWNFNKLVFAVHGWLGLSLGLPLFVICFSGTIAVVSHEIDWLINPAIRAAGPASPVDWQAGYESVRAAYPGRPIRSAWAPVGEGFALEFWVGSPNGNFRVYVEPTTGEILGTGTWFNTQRFFRDFHRRFFWGSAWGITLVSAFAIPLLISVITGLIFYKRWWAKLLTLRFHKGLRVFAADSHRLTGAWSFVFALIIAVTGLWYLVEKPSLRSVREHVNRPDRIGREEISALGSVATPLPLSELIGRAQSASPDFEVKAISFPARAGQPIHFDGQAAAWLVRDRANRILLDPFSGRVLGLNRGEEAHPVIRWSDTADLLHFGTFGGLAVKLVWFAFGLFLSILMPTGVFLFAKRAEQQVAGMLKKRARSARAEKAEKLRFRGTGWLGFLTTTAVLILAGKMTYDAVLKQIPENHRVRVESTVQSIGPWNVKPVRVSRGSGDAADAAHGVEFVSEETLPIVRRVELAWGETEPPEKGWERARGGFEEFLTRAAPLTAQHEEQLWVAIEGFDGQRHVGSWPAGAPFVGSAESAPPEVYWLGGWGVVGFCGGFTLLLAAGVIAWYWLVWIRPRRLV